MIGITCACGNKPLLATLVQGFVEIDKMMDYDPKGEVPEVVFSIECTGCKAQTFFVFFNLKGEQRVEMTHKPGGECTKNPNTCTKLFCDWPKCGH